MDLREILSNNQFDQQKLIEHLKSSKNLMEEALELSLVNEKDISWRAAWMFHHALKKNDKRFKKYHQRIFKSFEGKKDGHQRELIKVLSNLGLSENERGQLFDLCMNLWENISFIPSVRGVAFKTMIDIIQDFPELKNELSFLVEERYLENLSPGIKRSIKKQSSMLFGVS